MKALHKTLAGFVLCGLVWASPASAYWMSSDTGMSLSVGAGHYLLGQAVVSSARAASEQASSGTSRKATEQAHTSSTRPNSSTDTLRLTATTFKPARGGSGLDALAATYPPSERAQARQKLQQMYDAWPQVAKRLDVPVNDVASGLSAFLIGAYMAYHNATFADEQFKTVAQQMRLALQDWPGFAELSDAERQRNYEQMVTLGMLMAITQSNLTRQPDAATAAQLHELGKRSLEGFLRVDADRVHVSAQGLRVR